MSIVVSGSLAFDTLFGFEGRFQDQILPERLDALSVSFFVPHMRREFGGCAGNVAYNLHLLGERALVVASLGVDGQAYLDRISGWGLDTSWIRLNEGHHTAQAMIMTDQSNNQITAFHPGAMNLAHNTAVPGAAQAVLGIVSPNGKAAMTLHAQQLATQGTPFVWDPGQGLPMFSKDELEAILPLAQWVAVNDYEADMLSQRMNQSFAELSQGLQGLIITRGEAGCDVWQAGSMATVPPFRAAQVADPTGCGDSFRAGLLYGLTRKWPLTKACLLGNRIGALKIAHLGGQNHSFDVTQLLADI